MKAKHSILRRLAAAVLLPALFAGFMITAHAGLGVGNVEPEVLHTDSPLYGKSALFCGDSICAASAYDYSNMPRWGWAGRIGRDYGMTWTNRGIDGASVSNVRGTNTVIAQLKQEYKTVTDYDFVILHGGTNDGWDRAPIGEMSDSTEPDSFDETTFAGGLENLFCYAKMYYPDAYIGYIINFRTPVAYGDLNDMTAYYDVAKQICDKWEIPYLDLYSDDHLNNDILQVETTTYTADKIHPNGQGYDLIYPYIAEFMENIAASKTSPVVWVAAGAAAVVVVAAVIGAVIIVKSRKKSA